MTGAAGEKKPEPLNSSLSFSLPLPDRSNDSHRIGKQNITQAGHVPRPLYPTISRIVPLSPSGESERERYR